VCALGGRELTTVAGALARGQDHQARPLLQFADAGGQLLTGDQPGLAVASSCRTSAETPVWRWKSAVADEVEDVDAAAQLVDQAVSVHGRARTAERADGEARERLADATDLAREVDRRQLHALQLRRSAGPRRRSGR
jgi:hypothetical protein